MSELIIPGANKPLTEVFYIVDGSGRETEVSTEDFWMYGPDAWSGDTTYVDMANLPKQEWQQQGDDNE